MGYQIAVITGEGTNARRLSFNLMKEEGLAPIWCEYDISEVISAKDKTDIFLMFLPEDKNAELERICLYLRDICIDEEKTVYLFGKGDMLAYARKYIPGLMISAMYDKDLSQLKDVIESIGKAVAAKGTRLNRLLIFDDGDGYLKDLSVMLRDAFDVTLLKPYIDDVEGCLATADIVLISLDMKMSILDQAIYMDIIERLRKKNRLKVIFITGRREDQGKINLISAQSAICLTKEIKAEKIAAYLKRNYSEQMN